MYQKNNKNQLPQSAGLIKLHKLLTQYRRAAPRVGKGKQGTQKRTNKHKRATTPPRVPTLNKKIENAPLPRVEQTNLPTASDFMEKNNLLTRL